MSLQEYTKAALKTESKIESVQTNEDRLKSILNILIGAGNLLDDLKKNIFYNREIDNEKFTKSADIVKHGYFSLQLPNDFDLPIHFDQNQLVDHQINIDPRVFHGIVGMATESTELLEALLNAIETGELDKVNTGEECGDSNWYQAILLDALDQDWQKMLNTNTKKLQDRYGESFSDEAANNRDLESERKILES